MRRKKPNKQGEGRRPIPYMLLSGQVSSVSVRKLTTWKSQRKSTIGHKRTSDLMKMVKYSFILWCHRFTTPAFYFYFAQMNKNRIRKVAIYCLSTRQNSLINHQGRIKRAGKWLPGLLGRIFPLHRVKTWRSIPLQSCVNKQLPGKKLIK